MNILVTGGAGYIGAHCCKELAARGFRPVVFDSLVKGHRENVRWGEFFQGDTGNAEDARRDCLARFRIDAVMHFAAFIEVGESVADPAAYYREQRGRLAAADAGHGAGAASGNSCSRPRRRSTATRCGCRSTKNTPPAPLSPYGWTKQMVETMLTDFGTAYGLRSMALRYFNAAGADRLRRNRGAARPRKPPHPADSGCGPGWAVRLRCTARITRHPTGPASGTTSTSPTWPAPTCWPSSTCWTAARAAPSTWARGRGLSVHGGHPASRRDHRPADRRRNRRPAGRGTRPVLVASNREGPTGAGLGAGAQQPGQHHRHRLEMALQDERERQ
ncbi:MAG: NAD-dependent epimerase/dehydratase family protein [Desulfobacterales bacterium]|nr:NAD-dependent epimerase/dehydratase family protein [Desulfobacterales bacterium]